MTTEFSLRARLEWNVNHHGVYLVGNRAGYLFLLEVVLKLIGEEYLESDCDDLSHLHFSDLVGAQAIREGRFVFSPGPLEEVAPTYSACDSGEQTYANLKDIVLFLAEEVGPDLWGEGLASGSHPLWVEANTIAQEQGPPASLWLRYADNGIRSASLLSQEGNLSQEAIVALVSSMRCSIIAGLIAGGRQVDSSADDMDDLVGIASRDCALPVDPDLVLEIFHDAPPRPEPVGEITEKEEEWASTQFDTALELARSLLSWASGLAEGASTYE